jgi:kumamolisin
MLSGPAAAVDRAFAVRIDRYRAQGGTTFYAPGTRPRLRGSLRGLVEGVSGLDNYHRLANLDTGGGTDASTAACGQSVGGYSPAQVLGAYNFAPLKSAGLDGAGQTVVFIEIDTFAAADLACFRAQYGLPPFNVSARPSQFGPPNTASHGEPDLDLEVVHSIAPAAHLVVYYTDPSVADLAATATAAMKAYPKAIFSISIGGCEVENLDTSGHALLAPDQTVWRNALRGLAATGGSAFVASGDAGAYTCGSRLTNAATGAEVPSVSDPASDPYATSVGGTTLFVGVGDTYRREAAWGGPFEQDGGGGGLSQVWPRPFYQRGTAVENRFSDGMRQVPDVAALGDANTGWNVFHDGRWDIAAGTSASAPLWAGMVALIDQSLVGHRLARVGFANPALYSFGEHPSAQPSPAFNDITRGNNLYYSATPGWDFATGWGTPNAAGLAADFIAYTRSRG